MVAVLFHHVQTASPYTSASSNITEKSASSCARFSSLRSQFFLRSHGRFLLVASPSSGACTGLAMVRAASSTAATENTKKSFYPGEKKGFVEEMRFVAMKLHRRDQSAEGEKEAEKDDKPLAKWEPSVEGYIRFLVDSKAVYDTLESIVNKAPHQIYAEFRNTGLERSTRLSKDLEWFKSQGYDIPEPGEAGLSYSAYLDELAEKDPPAFICHFYNVYFAHSAGGRMIGKQVSNKILGGAELEFYKYDGDLKEILAAVKEKLNKVAEGWTREQKNHCLEETEKSFKNSGKLLRLIIS